HHLFDVDNSGLNVDFNFGHLNTADTAIGEVGWMFLVGILTAGSYRHCAKFGASLLPTQRTLGVGLHTNRSRCALEIVRLSIQCGSDFSEQQLARLDRSAAG